MRRARFLHVSTDRKRRLRSLPAKLSSRRTCGSVGWKCSSPTKGLPPCSCRARRRGRQGRSAGANHIPSVQERTTVHRTEPPTHHRAEASLREKLVVTACVRIGDIRVALMRRGSAQRGETRARILRGPGHPSPPESTSHLLAVGHSWKRSAAPAGRRPRQGLTPTLPRARTFFAGLQCAVLRPETGEVGARTLPE